MNDPLHGAPIFAIVPEFDLADRMRKALRVSSWTVQGIAEHFGVGRNTVSTWINGRITPNERTLKLWAIACGVDLQWLRTGRAS